MKIKDYPKLWWIKNTNPSLDEVEQELKKEELHLFDIENNIDKLMNDSKLNAPYYIQGSCYQNDDYLIGPCHQKMESERKIRNMKKWISIKVDERAFPSICILSTTNQVPDDM